MGYPSFTAGDILAASDMNAVGWWLIKTQTVGTAVTGQDVTSCFSSNYSNYRVMWSGISASADTYMGARLLVGTTLNAANVQGNTFYVGTGAAGALTNANVVNGSIIEIGNLTNDSHNAGGVEVQQPQAAQYSYLQSFASDNNYFRLCSYVMTNTTQYDGIRLLPGSGTITGGTIRVYGYRN